MVVIIVNVFLLFSMVVDNIELMPKCLVVVMMVNVGLCLHLAAMSINGRQSSVGCYIDQ